MIGIGSILMELVNRGFELNLDLKVVWLSIDKIWILLAEDQYTVKIDYYKDAILDVEKGWK